MDGDASHVPIQWITAVLQEASKMLGNPTMFVLSVLGLQSTGKSTLLNTVFGLQFNVGAGRCTRGAFMQLLPLDEELKKETKCSYVLVVDTEGLRAPAHDPQEAQRHDNELATFVIGLANMTLINIYGEVPGDMDDILQTSVHAFLRMKKVNLTPSVQFVHQNTTASLKSAVSSSTFVQKLNECTVLAAEEEHCKEKYTCFSDVIKFNEETDVHHFPTLWKGDPPMAPVNQGYSNAAQKFKHHFINILKKDSSYRNCQNMSALGQKIKDLWNTLLKEDFVFSFKNTLEVIAYKKMETEWSSKWRWPFHKKMLRWEQGAENEIATYDLKLIDTLIQNKIKELSKTVLMIYNEIKKEMDDFFERDDNVKYSDWKSKFYFMLSTLSSDLEQHAKTRCIEQGKTRKAMSKYDVEQTECIKRVKKGMQEYIAHLSCSGVNQSDQGIEEEFNKFWEQLMRQEFSGSGSCIDVEHEVVEMLLKYKADYKISLQEKLKEENWGIEAQIQLSKHFPDVEQGEKLAHDEILAKAKKDVHERIKFYYPAVILQLLESIENMIDKDKDLATYKIASTLDFKIDIFLIACRLAVAKFEEMVDPQQLYLEKKVKNVFLTRFKNQFYQVKAEAAIANTLCASLEQPIKKQVTRALGTIMVGQMKISEHQHFNSKMALKAKILKDICEKDEFNDYIEYMKNVKQCLEKWIKIYTEEYCDMEVSEGITRLQKAAQNKVTVLVRVIENKVKMINIGDLRNWLLEFCEDETLLRELGLKRDDLIIEEDELDRNLNLDNFQDSIRQGLEELKLKLYNFFSEITCKKEMNSWTENPYDILKGTIVGCTEQCPFCGEQCDLLDSHAGDHRTAIHRPTCMAGYKSIHTKEMWTDFCPTLIASNRTFRNDKTDQKSYGYRIYRKFYPDWHIPADLTSQDCLYWKWFVANYKKEIAEEFSGKTPEVPDQWLKASKMELILYLERVYCTPSVDYS